MPITWVTMLVATLAIAGVPFFAGFYAKDAIIAATLEKGMRTGELIWSLPFWFLVVAAAMTAFYMFRLIFMTFHGEPRSEHAEHAHESPWNMTVPLIVLAGFAFLGGKFWPADPAHALSGGSEPWFLQLVESPKLARWHPDAIAEAGGVIGGHGAVLHEEAGPSAGEHGAGETGHGDAITHQAHSRAMQVSILAAGSGILLAALFYLWRVFSAARAAAALGGLYRLVFHKYYFDEFYLATVVRGTMALSGFLAWVDLRVVDGFVNGVGRFMTGLAGVSAAADRHVVDGMVNWVADSTAATGQVVRRMQTGRIQQYAYFTFAGVLVLTAILLLGLI